MAAGAKVSARNPESEHPVPVFTPTARATFSSHQVESNPFPFNYVANYTVSTEVASMEFRTENGTHIPISGLDDSLAITVAVNNGSNGAETGPEGAGTGGVPTAGAVNISSCDSVIVRVSMGNTNRRAGLFVQLNFTSLQGERSLLFLCNHTCTRVLARGEETVSVSASVYYYYYYYCNYLFSVLVFSL